MDDVNSFSEVLGLLIGTISLFVFIFISLVGILLYFKD